MFTLCFNTFIDVGFIESVTKCRHINQIMYFSLCVCVCVCMHLCIRGKVNGRVLINLGVCDGAECSAELLNVCACDL